MVVATPDPENSFRASTGRQFTERAAATFGTNVAVAGLSLLSVLITSRVLGAVGRGDIAFLTTTAFLAAQLASVGIGPATMVTTGRSPERSSSIAATAALLAFGLGLIAIVAAGGLLALVSPEATETIPTWTMVALAAGVPLVILHVSFQQLAQAHYRFAVTNTAWLLPPLVNAVANLGLAAIGELTVTTAVLAWVLGQALASLLLLVAIARDVGLRAPSRELAGELLGFGVRSHLARVLLIGNYRIDQWVLGVIAGSSALGTYSVAVAWSESLFFLPTALAAVQRPDLVRFDRARAGRLASRVFRLAVVLTLPAAGFLLVAAPLLTVDLFGSDFEDSALQLRILVFGAFGVTALKTIANALNAQGRPLLESAAVAVSFVFIVILDVILIPSRGAVGAAIASTVAYSLGGLAAVLIFCRTMRVSAAELLPRLSDARELRSMISAASDRRRRISQPESG